MMIPKKVLKNKKCSEKDLAVLLCICSLDENKRDLHHLKKKCEDISEGELFGCVRNLFEFALLKDLPVRDDDLININFVCLHL